jgi:type IV fimbrial biogenesis protein FimT
MRTMKGQGIVRARQCWSSFGMRGFTVIELMVVLTILGVLAALAAPSFNDAILSNKLAGYANRFVASAQLARSEGIKRNGVIRVCRSADGTACATSGTWQQGWIVFHDADNDGVVDAGETIIHAEQKLSPDYHFTTQGGGGYSLAFQPTGGLSAQVELTLCRATPSPGRQERVLRVSATGRTSVERTQTATCA